ncbi:S16 family serine protease [Phytohabitans aurantiacus]|nr:S16 family serine protease [Phytohabitans aurantiacus]
MVELDDTVHRMESEDHGSNGITPRGLADRLVDQQLWWRVCVEAVATRSDRLLEWYEGKDRATFGALAGRGEAAVQAARVLAGVGAALIGLPPDDRSAPLARALTHWSAANPLPRMPVTPSAQRMLSRCSHPGLRDVLSMIDRSAGDHTRAFLALQAAMLAGLPVTERCVRQVRVLFDHRGEEPMGKTGTLRVSVLPGGPSGLYPDPRTMTFFQADRGFVDALTAAWTYATRGRADPPCVLWSVTSVEGERQWRIEGDSLGAAFAVALCESLRGWSRVHVVRSRSAITGTVGADGSVGAVGGLDRKLEAAHRNNWRVVAPLPNRDACRTKPDGLKMSFVGNISQARRKAKRWLATRIMAGAGALLLVAGGAVVEQKLDRLGTESTAAREEQKREQRKNIATEMLMAAESLRESQPMTALKLAIAAVAVNDGPTTKASLLTALTVREDSTVLDDEGGVETVALGNDVAVAGGPSGVRLWNVRDRARPKVLASSKTASVFTEAGRDGGFVMAGHADGTIELWDPSNALQGVDATALDRPHIAPRAAAFFSGGRSGVIAWQDGMATIWTAQDGRITVQKTSRLAPTISWLALGADDHTLYVGTDRGTAVWELIARHSPALLRGPDPGMAYQEMAHAKRDRDEIALVRTEDKAVMLAMDNRLKPKRTYELAPVGRKEPVGSISMTPGGRTAISGSPSGIATVWQFSYNAGLGEYRPRAVFDGHTDAIVGTALSPDGALAMTVGRDGRTILWNLAHQDFTVRPLAGAKVFQAKERSDVVAVAGTPSAGGAFTLDAEGEAVVWGLANLHRPRRLGSLNGRGRAPVKAFALNAKGTLALVGSQNADPVLWDVSDPAAPRSFDPIRDRNQSVYAAAFSPDRDILVLSGDVEVGLWDVSKPNRPLRLGGIPANGHATRVAIRRTAATGSTYLLTADGGTARIWEVADPARPRSIGTVPGSGKITSVAFNPANDTVLISRDTRLLAEMWDIGDPAHPYQQPALGGHKEPVQAVALSANGRLALTAGGDGVVKVWNLIDPSRPQLLTPLAGHLGPVLSAMLLGNGGIALTGSADGDALLWDITELANIAANPVDRACQVARGSLSVQDWRRYAAELPYVNICPK